MQREVDEEEKLQLQGIQLAHGNSADLGVIHVVVECVIEEFGSECDAGDHHSMDIEPADDKVLVLDEAVNIHQRQDKTLPAAVCVSQDPRQVIRDGNTGWSKGVEFGDVWLLILAVVGFYQFLQHISQHFHHRLALRVVHLVPRLFSV